MKHLIVAALAFAAYFPAQAAWYCGTFHLYGTQNVIYGVVGEEAYGPAVYTHTKDPNKVVKLMKNNKCYCADGNTMFTSDLGLVFKKVQTLYTCQGKKIK